MRSQTPDAALAYICDTFAKEDEALSRVGDHLPESEIIMQTGPSEGKLLQVLATMIGAKKIVEVGVLSGHSAIWLARALPEDGHLYGVEKNYKRIGPSLENFEKSGVADKITLIEDEAIVALEKLSPKGPFDMIFIDADKGNYSRYLDWAEKHIRKGGLIVGDNTFLFGAMYGQVPRDIPAQAIEAMREFNQRLANPANYSSILIPTVEGMTVAVKLF
jgi:predicted O-methyltransferase YrrM